MERMKNFKDEVDRLVGEYIEELEEENKKLKEDLERLIKLSEHKTTTIMGLGKNLDEVKEENKKLKSDLSECECSMHFENDEVGYRKRECKKLKEEVRFLEECLDRKEKVNKNLREELDKLKSTYVYDAKQVRDIC